MLLPCSLGQRCYFLKENARHDSSITLLQVRGLSEHAERRPRQPGGAKPCDPVLPDHGSARGVPKHRTGLPTDLPGSCLPI